MRMDDLMALYAEQPTSSTRSSAESGVRGAARPGRRVCFDQEYARELVWPMRYDA